MTVPTAQAVALAVAAKGWLVFRGDHDLNLVALRAVPGTVDAFDDLLCVFYGVTGEPWTFRAFRCTTDPGKPSLEAPKRADGTAQVAVGQHRGAYSFGKHHDTYECLVPTQPIPVVRYRTLADFEAGKGTPSTSTTTQIHHASGSHPSTIVGAYSEGCIVLSDPDDFAAFMALCHGQVTAGNGRFFSLSVLPWPS